MKKNIFRDIYDRLELQERLAQMLILVSFLITFILARIVTYLQKISFLPNQSGDLHVHHLVPGIILLIVSGYCGIAYAKEKFVEKYMAILFGIGAALTLDEFGLWLYLRDVYWEKEGRISIDAIVIGVTILLMAIVLGEVYDYISARKAKQVAKKIIRKSQP